MDPIIISGVIAGLQAIVQLFPQVQGLIKLLSNPNGVTQADVDAAVKAMDDAVAAWDTETHGGTT